MLGITNTAFLSSGADFSGNVQTVTFSSETSSESVLVFITDDDEYEGTEEFYGTLTTTDGRVNIFEPDATITIVDDGRDASHTA